MDPACGTESGAEQRQNGGERREAEQSGDRENVGGERGRTKMYLKQRAEHS